MSDSVPAGILHELPDAAESESVWPINSTFPARWPFPAFGSAPWLRLTLRSRGPRATERFLKLPYIPQLWSLIDGPIPVPSINLNSHYSIADAGRWVETLLDADAFWKDINSWALCSVKTEQEELRRWWPVEDALRLCQRFHAYQQARYRWHEYHLEKRCERSLGMSAPGTPPGYSPKTAAEARASLIGWLSNERGYAKHPLVRRFRWANRTKRSPEWRAFDDERKQPSARRYQITRFSPSRPDELGWLILTWPIWNFHCWRWVDLGYALQRLFRVVDGKGKAMDFLRTQREQMSNDVSSKLDETMSMPGGEFYALFREHLTIPTDEETEWQWWARKKSHDKAIDALCRRAVGWLEILPRPKGRAKDEKPALLELAFRIAG